MADIQSSRRTLASNQLVQSVKSQRTHAAMIPAALVGIHSIRAPPDAATDDAEFGLALRPVASVNVVEFSGLLKAAMVRRLSVW
jgi:hypothetical protein